MVVTMLLCHLFSATHIRMLCYDRLLVVLSIFFTQKPCFSDENIQMYIHIGTLNIIHSEYYKGIWMRDQ